ncbi:putative ABC transport system ATP-binding protein [Kineosporia succinea]|uniref:ABC transport system ATP-binding protein n=1 Tax=Kineosporia succinea TaxID=84632 RepID=A0ABT9PCC1_9ACTN|nr:ABC transporter ATP-binding protein [Kineosporia succinea]MDP9830146.1 putative ABC transport system ATP-binding protein [Kineosporia succinea]
MSNPDPRAGRLLLRRTVLTERRSLILASALQIGHQAGEAAVPLLIGVIIDRAVGTGDTGALFLWLGVLLATFAFLSTSGRFGIRVGIGASVEATRKLRVEVARRALDSRGNSEGQLPGATVSIATGDVRILTAVLYQLVQGLAAAVGAMVAAAVLLSVSVPLGGLILVGTPLLLLAVRAISSPIEHRSAAQREQAARAAGVATDLVRGVRVIKGLRAERAGSARYRQISRVAMDASVHSARTEAGFSAAVIALNGGFLALVALLGGHLAVNGDITVGQLVSAVGLAQFLLEPLGTFGTVIAVVASGRASATRVAALLDAPPAVTGGSSRPSSALGGLSLEDVHGPGLEGVSLEVKPGELLGILTTSPEAGTTLRRYLGRELDPVQGSLHLDGLRLSDLEPEALREVVLVCPHEPDLFTGTLAGNVLAGSPAGAALDRVLAAANADQVAETLPDGLESAVAERGRSLSGGQRQRVALARALLRDPSVLVLHDPTTAVDTVTESSIATGLRELRAGRTTVLITSSPALLAGADRVVLVHDGTIAAEGPHTRLMAEHDLYSGTVLA